MQPLHLDDDARASSLLRRVTGDLYIGGSSTGPAPVSPSHSVGPAMRRGVTRLLRRCATRRPDLTARDTRIRGTSCTTPRRLPPCCAACHAGGRERRVCNVAGRSYDCQPKESSCSIRHTSPLFFRSGFVVPPWSLLPSLFLFLKISPARINGHDWDKCLLTPTHRRSSELRFALQNIQFRAD